MSEVGKPSRPDTSMSLITSMLRDPLDPGYAAAADRREAAGLARSTSLRAPMLIVWATIIGLLVGIAAAQLRGSDTTKQRTRASLIARIDDERTVADRRAQRASELRSEIAALDAETLRRVGGDLADDVEEVSLVTGAVPVRGPGFAVTLDDAPTSDKGGLNSRPREAGSADEGKVMSRDMQIVVNALWEAGAEAIAVNGHRLTSTSAIRFAGEAILVDFRPLSRPYVITAIGDPGLMPASFADGDGGTYLSTLKNSVGIQVDTSVRESVQIPASAKLGTRLAQSP